MKILVGATMGLAVAGPGGAVLSIGVALLVSILEKRRRTHPIRPLLLILLVELRAGRSTLAALQQAAAAFPQHQALTRVSRVATVSGLTAAVEVATGDTRRLIAQLARSQRSGSPVVDTVRSLLESDIAAERTRRLEKARTLTMRLMIPIALLVLPGLVLLLYAPSLLRLYEDLSRPFT